MLDNLSNARHAEQSRRMRTLAEGGLCFFCRQGSASDMTLPIGIMREVGGWYIKENDFKLHGSVHHYLLVPVRHIADMSETTEKEASWLIQHIKWLKETTGVSGYSFFMRNGDTRYTGASMGHLHGHFISGGVRPDGKLEDLAFGQDILPIVLGYVQK